MSPLDQTLHALAEPTRRRAIDVLSKGPCSAGVLAKRLAVSPAALSRHLRVLRRASLIDDARSPSDQRVRMLHLKRERLAQVAAWTQSFWTEELDALQAHLDNQGTK